MIKILIADDQTILQDSLEHIISDQPDMEVVGKTDDAAETPELCRKFNPNLILMDVVTKNESNGLVYSAKILKEFPDIKIVIMTSLPDITFIEEAKKAGAHSFVYKHMGKEHFYYVIRNTMAGHGVYPGPADFSSFAVQFTETEIAVLRLVCQGKTREETAKELGLSDTALGRHITSILDKSGFDSISKFAIYAVGKGLISPVTIN